MLNFNVDIAIECIKTLCDNTQCVICDKLISPLVRFTCGHAVCELCAQQKGECVFCISSPTQYLVDKPRTIRHKNAAFLLNTFQKTFNVDVSKRKRISDHLKIEKQLFPECIQAPHKYSNTHKNFNKSFKNKENIGPQIFPGEEIKKSDIVMKKSLQYVQNWLNQLETKPQPLLRKPFGDININTQSPVQKPLRDVLKLKNTTGHVNSKRSTHKKRTHLKSIQSSFINNTVKTDVQFKNVKRQLEIKEEKNSVDTQIYVKCDENESGIVIEDEPNVVEDTVTNVVDKDKQAWLAVLEAAKRDEYEHKEVLLQNESVEMGRNTHDKNFKEYKVVDPKLRGNDNDCENMDLNSKKNVLFYKKSSLFEMCKLCCNNTKPNVGSITQANKFNDVSIVINNSAFITTVKFMHCEEDKKTIDDKKSVAIQTDTDSLIENKINVCNDNINSQKRKNIADIDGIPTKMLKHNDYYQNLTQFATNKESKKKTYHNSFKRHKCLISDSDTDSNGSCENTHEITVDVHQSSVPETVECGILRTLAKNEYERKTKRQIRSHTPNSSNSSDKENLDPNRKKVIKLGKKQKNKK